MLRVSRQKECMDSSQIQPNYQESPFKVIFEQAVRTKDTPRTVQLHVAFLKFGEINTMQEKYDADILLKMKWKEPSFDADKVDPAQLKHVSWDGVWDPKIFIDNVVGEPKVQQTREVTHDMNGDAWVEERRRVKGTFMEQLELWEFPFDVQDLSITVLSELHANECLIEQEAVHRVQRQNFIDEQEWYLYKYVEGTCSVVATDRADPSVKRSCVVVKCRAARRPAYFIWNIFSVTLLICLLAFVTFAIAPDIVHLRLQTTFTLLLTSVAFKFIVNQSLPTISYLTYLLTLTLILTTITFKFVVAKSVPCISYLTYLDSYVLATIVVLASICFWHGLQTVIPTEQHPYKDYIALGVLLLCYVLYNIRFIYVIMSQPYKRRREMYMNERIYVAKVKQHAEKYRLTLHKQHPEAIITVDDNGTAKDDGHTNKEQEHVEENLKHASKHTSIDRLRKIMKRTQSTPAKLAEGGDQHTLPVPAPGGAGVADLSALDHQPGEGSPTHIQHTTKFS